MGKYFGFNGLYTAGLRAEIFFLDWREREDAMTHPSDFRDQPHTPSLAMVAYWVHSISESDLRYGKISEPTH